MTHKEAAEEARRRWGPGGWATFTARTGSHNVGDEDGALCLQRGTGKSWEEAFADADKHTERLTTPEGAK